MFADFELVEKLRTEINQRGGEIEFFFNDAFQLTLAIFEEMKAKFSDFKSNFLTAFQCLTSNYATKVFEELKEDFFNEILSHFEVSVESEEMAVQLNKQ